MIWVGVAFAAGFVGTAQFSGTETRVVSATGWPTTSTTEVTSFSAVVVHQAEGDCVGVGEPAVLQAQCGTPLPMDNPNPGFFFPGLDHQPSQALVEELVGTLSSAGLWGSATLRYLDGVLDWSDTNGVTTQAPYLRATLELRGRATDSEGRTIEDKEVWGGFLPNAKERQLAAQGMARRLMAWTRTWMATEDYVGPVVFTEQAAHALIADHLLARVRGLPPVGVALPRSLDAVVQTPLLWGFSTLTLTDRRARTDKALVRRALQAGSALVIRRLQGQAPLDMVRLWPDGRTEPVRGLCLTEVKWEQFIASSTNSLGVVLDNNLLPVIQKVPTLLFDGRLVRC